MVKQPYEVLWTLKTVHEKLGLMIGYQGGVEYYYHDGTPLSPTKDIHVLSFVLMALLYQEGFNIYIDTEAGVVGSLKEYSGIDQLYEVKYSQDCINDLPLAIIEVCAWLLM